MIAAFLGGLESVFAWMLEASWQASVLAALVLLLQWALRGRLNPRWHHALWLLVVARLILPVLPESALSLFQFAPAPPPTVELTMTEPMFTSAPPMPEVPVSTKAALMPPRYPISALTILALVWLAGAAGWLVLTWWVNRCFARHILNAPAITDPRLVQLAETARHELGLRGSLRMIESAQVQSPAIMGLFRPTLILPQEVRARFDDDELRFIFLHEFAHLKRGDLLLQWLVALLQIVHWFNPVLWYAFRRMRADREPATDALVLSRTGEAEKEPYGQVLVKLLEHYQTRHSLPTLVGILEDKEQFKRRFSLIARFTHGAYGWSMLGVLLIAALGAICLTKAKAQDEPPKAYKYLELVFVEEPGALNHVRGSGPVSAQDVAQLLNSPQNKVAVMSDVALKDGPISLKGKTPAGFSVTISGDWNASLNTPQKIDYRIDNEAVLTSVGTMMSSSWETKDVLSEDAPLVIFQPWKPESHANVIIRIVDHPTSASSKTDSGAQSPVASADPIAATTSDTLAQLVLALHDSAKSIPDDHQRLQILQAFYGADGSWRDVTGILQKSVQNNSLKVSWRQPYTEIGGDPAYLQVKTLIVSYRLDGVEKLATFREENPPVGLQAAIPPAPASTSNAPTGDPTIADALTVRTFLAPFGFFKATPADHGDVKPDLIARGIAFPAGATAFYLTAGAIDLAVAGKIVVRNTPEQLDKIAALIETAAHDAPISSTSTQPIAPPMQGVTVSGKLQLVYPKEVDLAKSVGYLQSVDGGSIEFYFQPDGSFAVPNVKPEVYNRHIHFVPADPTLAEEASDMILAPLTIDGSAARMTTNLNLAVRFGKLPRGNIEIGLKVLEISDDVYLANKAKVDAAADKADIGFFNNMEGVSLLSTPSVSTQPGTKANIEIVREFPYPTEFEPGKVSPHVLASVQRGGTTNVTLVVPPTPREFASKDLGVSAEITPTINAADSPDPGKIVLNGKFSMTDFDGFTKSNVTGVRDGMPSFTTSESLFLEQLNDHQEKGIWIPGEHVALQNPTAANFNPDWETTAPMIKKPYLLFVSASLVR